MVPSSYHPDNSAFLDINLYINVYVLKHLVKMFFKYPRLFVNFPEYGKPALN